VTQALPEALADLEDAALIADLDAAKLRELELRHYARVGDDLVWIEPGRRVRRERASRVYYVQTARGVFRVSRLTGEVIEV
jgi:hypothetical protein